ncbi:DUF2169 family type VI secretion system accessory protein [Sorangium sp. So ce131]|uniref:DUF2169 family type VI secretion system accessory protein n=1 Tax=Sorangium sp. So ce131 TaxID=3133282 RepID=UPI003F5DA125
MLPRVAISPVGHVAAATVVFRVSGQLRVAAVVKASFAMVQDRDMLLTEPDPLVPVDMHRDNNPAASLVASSDLVPYRARADVLLTGHARAPEGQSVASMGVRLLVALDRTTLLDKRLAVQGWTDAARPTPAPFAAMPLAYELAAGGPGVRDNPVGVPERSARAPNVLDGWRRPSPVGFGPLAPTWPVRRALLGPAHEAALRQPVPDLGVDFPWAYFNAAPEDQRIDYLRGDEWIGFEGMTPTLPRAQSRLPGLRGVARVYGPAPGLAAGRPVALVADTLLIDADRMRVSVVWRGSFQVASEGELASLHLHAGVEAKGRPLAFPEAYRPPRDEGERGSGDHPLDGTIDLSARRSAPPADALPFARSEPIAAAPAPASLSDTRQPWQSEIAVLPFSPAEPSLPRDRPPRPLPAATPFERPPHVLDPRAATLDVDRSTLLTRGRDDVAQPQRMASAEVAAPAPRETAEVAAPAPRETAEVAAPPPMIALEVAAPLPGVTAGIAVPPPMAAPEVAAPSPPAPEEGAPPAKLGAAFLRAISRATVRPEGPGAR